MIFLRRTFCLCRFLQFFNKIQWVVVWLCIVGFIEGAAVNGFTNINLTTLERRFTMTSSQSGLIVSSTDIGAMVFVLFVSYLGSKGNRPQWLAVGTWVMGLGSLIFLIPHMASDSYNYLGQGKYFLSLLRFRFSTFGIIMHRCSFVHLIYFQQTYLQFLLYIMANMAESYRTQLIGDWGRLRYFAKLNTHTHHVRVFIRLRFVFTCYKSLSHILSYII